MTSEQRPLVVVEHHCEWGGLQVWCSRHAAASGHLEVALTDEVGEAAAVSLEAVVVVACPVEDGLDVNVKPGDKSLSCDG